MFISAHSAQMIVDEMCATIHHHINLIDRDGTILASTDPARTGQIHEGALRLLRTGGDVLILHKEDAPAGTREGINLPISLAGETVGVIGVTGPPEEIRTSAGIIKKMAEIMLIDRQRQEKDELIDRARDLFMEHWLFSEDVRQEELEIRGGLLGFDLSVPRTVVLLQTTAVQGQAHRVEDLQEMQRPQILRLIQQRMRGRPQDFCAAVHDQLLLLFWERPQAELRDDLRQICTDIQSFYPVRVQAGISSVSRDTMDIRRCYQEARTALTAAIRSGQALIPYDGLSLDLILQNIPRELIRDVRRAVFAGFSEAEKPAARQMLQTYFKYDGDLRRCAEETFVHRNTFQYRLDRFAQRTGRNPRRFRDLFLLYLAVWGSDGESPH